VEDRLVTLKVQRIIEVWKPRITGDPHNFMGTFLDDGGCLFGLDVIIELTSDFGGTMAFIGVL